MPTKKISKKPTVKSRDLSPKKDPKAGSAVQAKAGFFVPRERKSIKFETNPIEFQPPAP
jgi:hypothetical protein